MLKKYHANLYVRFLELSSFRYLKIGNEHCLLDFPEITFIIKANKRINK